MASDVRTIKGPCFDECRNGIQEVRSPGFLDFYMECGCTYEGATVPTPKIDPETRPNGGIEMAIENGDLLAACESNSVDSSDLVDVILEITGENDEASWHWIVKTTSGFAYISGWCDYTGWDCQSGAERHDAATQEAALALSPQDVRRVFEDMLAKGERARPNTGGL